MNQKKRKVSVNIFPAPSASTGRIDQLCNSASAEIPLVKSSETDFSDLNDLSESGDLGNP